MTFDDLNDLFAGLFPKQRSGPSQGQTPNDLIMQTLGNLFAGPNSGTDNKIPAAHLDGVLGAPRQNRLPGPSVSQGGTVQNLTTANPEARAARAAPQTVVPGDTVPEPTLLDRFAASGEGYRTGGIVGALTAPFIAPDQAAAEKRRQITTTNVTFQALKRKGLNDDEAYAIVSNRDLMKEVLPKLFSPEQPTDEMREYNLSVAQDRAAGKAPPSFTDWKTGLKRAGASSTNIDLKQEGAYDKTMGETLAKEFVGAQTSGATASRDLGNLAVMKSAMEDPNMYTGTGGMAVNSLKKAAQTVFGVNVKGVSNAELVSNLASEIAVGNKQKLPGPMSDADRQFLVDMAPNLSKSPEGNRLIIELGMAGKRWEIARAKLVRDYAAQHGGRIDAGVYTAQSELDNATAQEFGDILGKLRGMGEAAPRSPAAGTPINSLRNKYQGLE